MVLPLLTLLPLLLLGLSGAVPRAALVAGLRLSESIIWAINAGGEVHVDMHGIHFCKDLLEGSVGLNRHVVVKDLDISDRVGHSTAHDEIIPSGIKKGKLSVQGKVSTFTGKLHIEFVSGYYDNPSDNLCTIYHGWDHR